MKIIFFCRHFHQVAGGVERMSITIMNEMIIRGHDVHLLTWDQPDAEAFYPMDHHIIWHKIPGPNPKTRASIFGRIHRAIQVRQILRKIKPDLAVGFQFGSFLVAVLYGIGFGIPVVCAERNSPSRYKYQKNEWAFTQFLFMSFAKGIVVQLDAYKNYYPWYLRHKIVVISNPIYPVAATGQKKTETQRKKIISVGRLTYQKNFQILLQAFIKLSSKHKDWDLEIAGSGEDLDELQFMVNQARLGDRVIFRGNLRDDLKEFYRAGNIFALPSRWEGFPNALAEAMSYGLPTLGYCKCDGVSSLIQNERTGLLAEGNGNFDSFVEQLTRLMESEDLRERMGKNAQEDVEAYNPQKIFNLWEKTFITFSEQVEQRGP
jgi:GalNAc-alpha-(1->4)-GalNAc-alpha-(1->3)-diNAcBac-PP-undecaprenol alpha-1,4-N-acetyl-D-galactosaminyltransferase